LFAGGVLGREKEEKSLSKGKRLGEDCCKEWCKDFIFFLICDVDVVLVVLAIDEFKCC